MAGVLFRASTNMLSTDSWLGETLLTSLTAEGGSEVWMFDDTLLASDGTYTRSQLSTVLNAGANAIIFYTDSFPPASGNVTHVVWYTPDQEELPEVSNQLPYAVNIDNISMPYSEFANYFTTGNQSEFMQAILSDDDFLLGSIYNDVILGYGGNDEIEGMAGNDILFGYEGSDTLKGGSGNDTLVGGTGEDSAIDYARFSNSYAGYTVTKNIVGTWIVAQDSTFLSPFNDGTDSLNGIERLDFFDQNLALDIDGDPAKAYRIYKAAFDRAPDLAGLGFWIYSLDVGQTGLQMAQGFVNSEEFTRTYGVNSSYQDFVERLYLNILDRPGEDAGVNFWINALQNGASRAEILLEFSESRENVNNIAPFIENGIAYTPFVPA